MPDKQLLSPEAMTLMDNMIMHAFYAYVGQLNPSVGEVQGGVIEIHIPLLDRLPKQTQASYLDRVETQLDRIVAAPGVTPAQRILALQIKKALSGNIATWFALMRQVAAALVVMPKGLLLQPQAQSLLDDLVALSNVAFVGRLDPATNTLQPGIVQVFYNIQRLASFDLKPLSSST